MTGTSQDRTDRDGCHPSVTVVIPTHNRPELLRRAIDAALGQEYAGAIDVLVVYDRSEPDPSLARSGEDRSVRVLANARIPGLAGARNTGILEATGDFVAFCDDDDVWLPSKLVRQVDAWRDEPDAEFVTTAMLVDYDGRRSERLAGRERVEYVDLLRSRMAMLHSSSFLIRRAPLLDGLGLVDETLPESMAEDWELLLRTAARRPIVHVDEPLVEIRWGATSYFAQQWQTRNEAQLWLLEHHPQMARDRLAAGHSYGKLAFGYAAQGRRREALRWSWRALRVNWREPRTCIAITVVCGLPWRRVLRELNKRGHGI